MTVARCGTSAGYRAHQENGEKPCDACASAKREYDVRWRAAGINTQRNRANANAQSAALRRLSKLYPDVYTALYAEEKARTYDPRRHRAEPWRDRRDQAQAAAGLVRRVRRARRRSLARLD